MSYICMLIHLYYTYIYIYIYTYIYYIYTYELYVIYMYANPFTLVSPLSITNLHVSACPLVTSSLLSTLPLQTLKVLKLFMTSTSDKAAEDIISHLPSLEVCYKAAYYIYGFFSYNGFLNHLSPHTLSLSFLSPLIYIYVYYPGILSTRFSL